MKNLEVGSIVFFTDPDPEGSSGYYVIDKICSPDGVIEDDTLVLLHNSYGSELEAFASELQK